VFEDRTVFLPDLLRERREQMVLKKARSRGGSHVVLGRFAAPEEWEATLAEALESGDWVAQEHVASYPYLFQDGAYGCSPHDVVWGFFVFGSTPGGEIIRAQPRHLGGIVNLTRGASEGILLEVDP